MISQTGVFDFYQDWSDEINIDLQQLTTAVDQVLGNSAQNAEMPAVNTNSDLIPGTVTNDNVLRSNRVPLDIKGPDMTLDLSLDDRHMLVKAEIKEEPIYNDSRLSVKDELKLECDVKFENSEPGVDKGMKDERENELADLLEDQRKNEFNPHDIFTTGDSDEEKRKDRKPLKSVKDKQRRDSIVDKKIDKKKDKDKKDKKKQNKIRKLSSEYETEAEKKKRKKKYSDCDSNTSGPDSRIESSPLDQAIGSVNTVARKISEISGSSGSPVRPAPSVSPESDLLSPDHSSITSEVLGERPDATDLDIKELDKSNQSVRERMEQMVKEKNRTKPGDERKRKDKHKKRDSLKGREKFSSDLTQEAVRSLSFEGGSEKSREDQEQTGNMEDDENSEEREQPNEELIAALAGLDSDFDFGGHPTKKDNSKDKAGTDESPTKTVGPPDQEVKIKVIPNSENLLDKKFKRQISAAKTKDAVIVKAETSADFSLIMPSVTPGLPDDMREFSDEEELRIVEETRKSNIVKVSPVADRRNSQPDITKPITKERRLSTVSCNSDTSAYNPKPDVTNISQPTVIERQSTPMRTMTSSAIGAQTIKLPGANIKQKSVLTSAQHPTVIAQQKHPTKQPQQMTVLQIAPGQTAQSPITIRATPVSSQSQPQQSSVHILKSPNVVSLPVSSRITPNANVQIPSTKQVHIPASQSGGQSSIQQTVITPTRQPTSQIVPTSKTLLIRSNPSPSNNVQLQQPTAQIRTVTQQQVLVQPNQANQGNKIIQVPTASVPMSQQSAVYRPGIIRTITTQGNQIQTGQGTGYMAVSHVLF